MAVLGFKGIDKQEQYTCACTCVCVSVCHHISACAHDQVLLLTWWLPCCRAIFPSLSQMALSSRILAASSATCSKRSMGIGSDENNTGASIQRCMCANASYCNRTANAITGNKQATKIQDSIPSFFSTYLMKPLFPETSWFSQ